jgi:hypothetical protein
MSSGIFRFFGASVATMLFVGFALAPTPAPAQGLQCASNPLIGRPLCRVGPKEVVDFTIERRIKSIF